MTPGIVVSSDDAETVWNALRLANFTLARGDEVKLFLFGKGVMCPSLDRKNAPIILLRSNTTI